MENKTVEAVVSEFKNANFADCDVRMKYSRQLMGASDFTEQLSEFARQRNIDIEQADGYKQALLEFTSMPGSMSDNMTNAAEKFCIAQGRDPDDYSNFKQAVITLSGQKGGK